MKVLAQSHRVATASVRAADANAGVTGRDPALVAARIRYAPTARISSNMAGPEALSPARLHDVVLVRR